MKPLHSYDARTRQQIARGHVGARVEIAFQRARGISDTESVVGELISVASPMVASSVTSHAAIIRRRGYVDMWISLATVISIVETSEDER